jgi:4'-phosphopantetheinyl transferase
VALVARLQEILSPDERSRAARYRNPRDGHRFIVRRALLRRVLGACVGVAPRQIVFGYGPAGKPFVREPSSARTLRFNLAHSAGLAVYACGAGHPVGIDIERARRHGDLDDVASRFFSRYERATLASLPRSAKTVAFYRCWTRKEAYVKAIGSGIAGPLDDFDVAFAPDAPAALLRVGWQPSEPGRWRIEALDVPHGYIGAITVARSARVDKLEMNDTLP